MFGSSVQSRKIPGVHPAQKKDQKLVKMAETETARRAHRLAACRGLTQRAAENLMSGSVKLSSLSLRSGKPLHKKRKQKNTGKAAGEGSRHVGLGEDVVLQRLGHRKPVASHRQVALACR